MLDIKDLCVSYGEQVIFDKFNLSIEAGQTVCILGRSGCGKTTLLHATARLIGTRIIRLSAEQIAAQFDRARQYNVRPRRRQGERRASCDVCA